MGERRNNWSELRTRTVGDDAGREAPIAARKRAIVDSIALADLRESFALRQTDTWVELAELRKMLDLPQRELAEAMAVSPMRVSAIERQHDVYLSTLRSYIEALGGELELTARFGDKRVPIGLGAAEPR